MTELGLSSGYDGDYKCGIRNMQGFRLRFKEWMLSVKVVRSVVSWQMCVFVYVCVPYVGGRGSVSKSRKAALFIYKDSVWDLGLSTSESDTFQTLLRT